MATTATRVTEFPAGSVKVQIWRIEAGASDTTATWSTGLYEVHAALSASQDDSSHGVVINSNDGTEDSVAGDVYLDGVINSAVLDVVVFGN